jgi:hypothetical protein
MDDTWDNWEKLNDELLYLGTDGTHQLQDVDVTAGMGLADDRVLLYNSGSGKWEPWKPHISSLATTTTTTTSTTSSTSSTSSTSTTTTAP